MESTSVSGFYSDTLNQIHIHLKAAFYCCSWLGWSSFRIILATLSIKHKYLKFGLKSLGSGVWAKLRNIYTEVKKLCYSKGFNNSNLLDSKMF